FAAVVVFPEPCSPTSRITVGPTGAKSSVRFVPPKSAAISSCTSFATCWPGLTDFTAITPTARSRTRSTNPVVTSKLTSAASRWRRISRSASVTSCSDSTPRPVSRLRVAVNRSERAVNISLRNYLASCRNPSGGSTRGTGDPNRRHPFPARPSHRRVHQPHHGYFAHQQLLDLRSPARGTARPSFRPGALEPLLEARSRRFVIPQRVPNERVSPTPGPPTAVRLPPPEHPVAVAIPARREQGGGAGVAQVLLQQQADLELAQPVLVAHRVGTRRLERQCVGPIPGHVPRGVQDLLGGDRHEDAVGLLPRVLVVEPAHELGAPQVGEDQALAQPQRCAPEHLHLILLPAERRPQVPEVWQAFDLLLRHEDQDLGERRLPLEDRLRRAAPIVLTLELHQRVEV